MPHRLCAGLPSPLFSRPGYAPYNEGVMRNERLVVAGIIVGFLVWALLGPGLVRLSGTANRDVVEVPSR